jgi:uncharacterized protein
VTLRVASLHVYPVKACAGQTRLDARVDALGLEDDRRYAILGASGRVLTQRDLPQMATIRPSLDAGTLWLDLGGLERIEAPEREFTVPCEAKVWSKTVPARAAAGRTQALLSDFLGTSARLVDLASGARRSFADSKPVLVVTTASLQALNGKLGSAVGLERFRGNIVVDGAAPLAELGWRRLSAGALELEFAEACERCEVPTIDQSSGRRMGEEPLQTLAAQFDSVFGARFGVARAGHIVAGEALTAA